VRKIIVVKGLSGSGKSTWAKKLIDKHTNVYKRINKDDLRTMFDNYKYTKGNENFVLTVRDLLVVAALDNGKHVIIDDTNLNPKHEERMRQIAKEYSEEKGTQVVVEVNDEFLKVPIEECIKRDLTRLASVGEKVIRSQYNQWLKPKPEPTPVAEQDESLPMCIIIDIDGTLAEKGDRSPYEWEKVGLDKPKKDVIDLVQSIGWDDIEKTEVIFFSGRDSVCRKQTIDWLVKQVGGDEEFIDERLFMRPEGDQRKDTVIKKELYENHVLGKYRVRFILDDRDQVVNLWRNELGLTCLQVDYGNF